MCDELLALRDELGYLKLYVTDGDKELHFFHS